MSIKQTVPNLQIKFQTFLMMLNLSKITCLQKQNVHAWSTDHMHYPLRQNTKQKIQTRICEIPMNVLYII